MTKGTNSPAPTTAQIVGGVYNATPPVLQDGQGAALQLDISGKLITSGSGGGGSNVNITGVNSNPPALANPLPVELSDGTNAVGTAGNPLSVNVITGGGSNASVAATGAAVPASATYVGVNKGGTLVAPLADPSGNLQTVVSEPLPAGTNVIGHVIADAGSTTAVTGNVTVVQPTGTQLHAVVDSGSITAVQPTGTNLHTVVDSGTITSITNQVDTNLKQVGGSNTATAAAGVQKVGAVGGTGVILDAVLGATKPANVLQVGGNDGTNAFAVPLASGGGSVVVSGTVTITPSGTQTVTGNLTNNNAAPAASNVGVLPALANTGAPVDTEGDQVLLSVDLAGNARVTLGGTPVFSQAAVSSKSSGSVASLTAAYGSNVKLGTTLVVSCAVGNVTTPTITDTIGNTYIQAVNKASAAHNTSIFYAINKTAGANTVTVNNGGATASIAMTVYEVPGFLTAAPLDFVASANATSVAPASGFVDPSFPGSYAFGAIGVGTAPQTVTVTTNSVPSPVWTNDSGQQNPTTPAGLQSFVAGSAFVGKGQTVQFAGTITSEPWTAVMAVFRPYAIGVQGEIQGTVPNGTATPGNPVIAAGTDVSVGSVKSLVTVGNNLMVSLTGAAAGGVEVTTGNVVPQVGPGGGIAVPAVMSCGLSSAQTGAAATIGIFRIPNVWRGTQFVGPGVGTVWTPPATKKARLMKYCIAVSEDATISGGPLPINIAFAESLGTATQAFLAYPGFGFTHRVVVPASVLATSGELYESNFTDLGNGQILSTAGRPLLAGIQIPQTTGAVNPAWTIASNQWEAATIGIKTDGNRGNFKLVQQTTAVSSAATTVSAALQNVTGSAIFVLIRTTNIAGGAPTVAVTDTAGNTYTVSALTTNATDGANGSSICIASAVNIVGNAANVITVTTSVHIAAQTEAIYLEYAGMGTGGVDAALVGTTGNSTTPASGNYTPATAGDLILSFFATSASLASQPTVGSNFLIRGAIFNGTQGALAVADNFGNGSLTAGVVNIQAVGTEE